MQRQKCRYIFKEKEKFRTCEDYPWVTDLKRPAGQPDSEYMSLEWDDWLAMRVKRERRARDEWELGDAALGLHS